MKRFAKGIGGAEVFNPSDEALKAFNKGDNSLIMMENQKWVDKLIKLDYTVIDLGLDPKWVKEGNLKKGQFYEMETQRIFGDN